MSLFYTFLHFLLVYVELHLLYYFIISKIIIAQVWNSVLIACSNYKAFCCNAVSKIRMIPIVVLVLLVATKIDNNWDYLRSKYFHIPEKVV